MKPTPKSKFKRLFIFFLIFILVFSGGTITGWFLANNRVYTEAVKMQRQAAIDLGYYSEDSAFLNNAPVVEPEKNWQNNKIKQSGWIAYWAFNNGTNTYYTYSDQFESLSPVWYELKENGVVDVKTSYANASFLYFAKNRKTKIIPTISNFNVDIAKTTFLSNDNIDKLANTILKEVDTYGFDGIDIDFEHLSLEQKDGFYRFMNKLSTELHSRNKVLTIAVLAKYTDLDVYSGLKETRKVLDYKELGKIVDEVRIMAYDYTAQSSYKNGPIAPIEWVESVVQYAVTQMPPEKVMLGIPLYARGWSTKGGTGTSYTYAQIKDEIANERNTLEDSTKENLTRVKINQDEKDLWFNDKASVDYRRNVAKKYGIKGVIFWSLGGEDEKIWK